ncbi:MAG: nucleotidyltransferase domain-containing protein [Solirubrobacteraceae bacterium]
MEKLNAVPGVVAVALGGSRATGSARAGSDWDLGVYYRTRERRLDPDDVRALGYEGEVSALGAWGPIVNGGAWLTVEGIPVDLLFRDLDIVEHWLSEAHAGRFEVLDQHGCLVGAPTYILAGELALARPLIGPLPRGAFSDALAASAPDYWHGRARVSLMFAEIYARTNEHVCCLGMLASAILCAAHSRLTSRREWALNEKHLVERAGLRHTQALISAERQSIVDLAATVTQVSAAIGVDPLRPR